jgi:Glutathione S-transferase, N-terminal domain
MQLIGMLDSPYVRRAAISLELLGVPFEHKAVSVFTTFEQFQSINPVVKAPTLVCDDGEVLMDSTLIIDYAESLARPGKSLMPTNPKERQHELRLIGLALAACEKSVQTVYELNLRPAEKHHPRSIAVRRRQLRKGNSTQAACVRRCTNDASRHQCGNPLALHANDGRGHRCRRRLSRAEKFFRRRRKTPGLREIPSRRTGRTVEVEIVLRPAQDVRSQNRS